MILHSERVYLDGAFRPAYVVCENGRIAEEGTAEELLERKGVYYKLWTLQTEQMKKVAEGI